MCVWGGGGGGGAVDIAVRYCHVGADQVKA